MQSSISHVARLRAQISIEYESMKVGLIGLAAGVAKHAFIAHKMEQVGALQEQLAFTVGEKEAQTVICETYMSVFADE